MRLICCALFLVGMVTAGDGDHASVPVAEFESKMKAEKPGSYILLDVRKPDEYNAGHLKGARLINYYDEDFKEQLATLDKETKVYIYCRSGGRSGRTLDLMQDMGFRSVIDMAGGVLDWQKQGKPLVKGTKEDK